MNIQGECKASSLWKTFSNKFKMGDLSFSRNHLVMVCIRLIIFYKRSSDNRFFQLCSLFNGNNAIMSCFGKPLSIKWFCFLWFLGIVDTLKWRGR